MPNGGSDCCGTCWFNAKNKGDAGYDHTGDPEPDFCSIRNLGIEDAFYTYCANHPSHSKETEVTPIGPVFVLDSSYRRQIQFASADTEQIRIRLLELLHQIPEEPENEYSGGMYQDETIIWQLGEFRERRAVNDLKRITAFNPEAKSPKHPGYVERTRARTIAFTKEALEKIQKSD